MGSPWRCWGWLLGAVGPAAEPRAASEPHGHHYGCPPHNQRDTSGCSGLLFPGLCQTTGSIEPPASAGLPPERGTKAWDGEPAVVWAPWPRVVPRHEPWGAAGEPSPAGGIRCTPCESTAVLSLALLRGFAFD